MPGQLSVTGAQFTAYSIGAITLPTIGADRYVALLTSDPSSSGPGGGYAMAISDLVEDTTAGYSRQQVTFAPSPAAYDSSTTYTTGQQVSYEGFIYTCAVSSVTGTAPSGGASSNTDWTYNSEQYPVVIANTTALTFGPYTADQSFPCGWAALVDAASGTTGNLLYFWTLSGPSASQPVATSQSIVIPAGDLTTTQS